MEQVVFGFKNTHTPCPVIGIKWGKQQAAIILGYETEIYRFIFRFVS